MEEDDNKDIMCNINGGHMQHYGGQGSHGNPPPLSDERTENTKQ